MAGAIVSDPGILPEIIVTKRDFGKLHYMLHEYAPIVSSDAVRFLTRELDRARVVDVEGVPPTNVTMNSQVEIFDKRSGKTQLATLTYPGEETIYPDAVSILTPLGTALLGLCKSQSMSYVDPTGEENSVEVLRVVHQPEAQRFFKRTPRLSRSPDAF